MKVMDVTCPTCLEPPRRTCKHPQTGEYLYPVMFHKGRIDLIRELEKEETLSNWQSLKTDDL